MVFINPKLEKFENENKNYLIQVFQSKYAKIKNFKSSKSASSLRMNLHPSICKLLEGLFHVFFKFKKVKISNLEKQDALNSDCKMQSHLKNNTQNQSEKEYEAIKANFYMIFPNINLKIKRISALKLSNSSKINKFLVKKLENSNQLNDEMLDWGPLGMSLEHRIVALLNNKESRQQIIFGIWINFPKESGVKKNISDSALENIIQKLP
jgi:hypothetical protein